MARHPEGGERSKAVEYAPQDLAKLLLWSFHMSQGSGFNYSDDDIDDGTLVHKAIFQTLFALHPQMPQGIRHWIKNAAWAKELKTRNFSDDDPTDDNLEIRNSLVEKYVDEVCKWREGHGHAQKSPDVQVNNPGQAHLALKHFLLTADEYLESHQEKRKSSERAAEQERSIGDLVARIVNRDVEIINELAKETPLHPLRLMRGPDAERLRAAKGHSMFCLYALSKRRVEARHFLPKEYQDLWERMGDYVRRNVSKLSEKSQKQLKEIAAKFEETTGEKVEYGHA